MINFEFTRVYNGNDPRVFKCNLLLDDEVLSIVENSYLKGGELNPGTMTTVNTTCSLQYNKYTQIELYKKAKRFEKEISDYLVNN